MSIALIVFLFALGLLLTVKGSGSFVESVSFIAERFGIPKIVLSSTLVSIVTTLPELLVSTFAAAQGRTALAVGNAVGSVTANVAFILALTFLYRPTMIKNQNYLVKSMLIIAACGVLLLSCKKGQIGLLSSLLLLLLFAVFVYDNVSTALRKAHLPSTSNIDLVSGENEALPKYFAKGKKAAFLNILKFIFGAVSIAVGAYLLVNNGGALAQYFKLPEWVMATTIIALGTSLPELVMTAAAISKKQYSISIGNILGASAIDLTFILPICGVVAGRAIPIYEHAIIVDIPFCTAVCVIALLPALLKKRFMKWQGLLLLCLYIIYVLINCGFITV